MSEAKYQGFAFVTKPGIIPASRTAGTFNGEGIDRLAYSHSVAELHGQGFTGTETLDVRVQDSATGLKTSTDWANFTPNVLFDSNNQSVAYAAFAQMTTNGVLKLDVDLGAAKRYVRFVGVVGSGTIVYQVSAYLNQRSGTAPGSTA
jgi:hypothetical protein